MRLTGAQRPMARVAPFLHKPRSGGLPGEETSVCGEAVVNRDGATGGIAHGFGNDRRLVTVLAFVALFALCSYAHDVLKTVIVEPNFGDFGNYYFNAGKLNEGVNVFILTADEERRLRLESGLPVHPCGGPGYAPIFQFLMGFLARLDFWSALGVWLLLNHVLLACVLAAVPFLAGGSRARSLQPSSSRSHRSRFSKTSPSARAT